MKREIKSNIFMINKARKIMNKICVICGKGIKVFLYPDKSYRGGHFFGRMNLGRGRTKAEYWECPKCYWGK